MIGAVLAHGCQPMSEASSRHERETLHEINALRHKHGLPALRESHALTRAAQGWALRMSATRRLQHSPSPVQLQRSYGYHPRRSVEIIARMPPGTSVEHLVLAWLESPEHREAMLDPEVVHGGAGLITRKGALWAVCEFGRPRPYKHGSAH